MNRKTRESRLFPKRKKENRSFARRRKVSLSRPPRGKADYSEKRNLERDKLRHLIRLTLFGTFPSRGRLVLCIPPSYFLPTRVTCSPLHTATGLMLRVHRLMPSP